MEFTLRVIIDPAPALISLFTGLLSRPTSAAVATVTNEDAGKVLAESIKEADKKPTTRTTKANKAQTAVVPPVETDPVEGEKSVSEEFAENKAKLEEKAAALAENKEVATDNAANTEGPRDIEKERIELRAYARERLDGSTNGTKEERADKIKAYLAERGAKGIPELDIQYWVHFRHWLKTEL